jgi:hypothetical protein
MTQYVGRVAAIYNREFSGKMTYSIKIDGSPLYFRLNDKRYPGIVEKGNMVEFEAEENSDGKSAKVIGAVRAGRAAPTSEAGKGAAVGGGVDWAKKDASIQYQSSRKDAVEFVKLLVQTGALGLPAAKSKQVAALELAVDRYTAQFFADIAELGAVKRTTSEEVEEGEQEEDEDE